MNNNTPYGVANGSARPGGLGLTAAGCGGPHERAVARTPRRRSRRAAAPCGLPELLRTDSGAHPGEERGPCRFAQQGRSEGTSRIHGAMRRWRKWFINGYAHRSSSEFTISQMTAFRRSLLAGDSERNKRLPAGSCLQAPQAHLQKREFEIRKYPAHSSPVRSALTAGDSRREIRRFRSECCGNFCPIR